jgi:hypothetical protein
MTAVDRTPINLNYLSRSNFKFMLKRAPNVDFFIQEVQLPSITLPPVDKHNPYGKVPFVGDQIEYEQLSLTFKVDEDLRNYREIFDWIVALADPTNPAAYGTLAAAKPGSGDGLVSDIVVHLLTNQFTSNYGFTFVDAWPIYISGLLLNSTDDRSKYLDATVIFRYSYYQIDRIL